jgi:transcriptional regulator with XRE-family HTH domain
MTDLRFRDELRRRCAAHGYSVRTLATAVGVNYSTTGRWLRGLMYPRIPELRQLCAVLHCTPNDLVWSATLMVETPVCDGPARAST